VGQIRGEDREGMNRGCHDHSSTKFVYEAIKIDFPLVRKLLDSGDTPGVRVGNTVLKDCLA